MCIRDSLFNGGQVYFSVLAAGFVLSAGGASAYVLLTPGHVMAIAAAAIALYMTNLLLVSIAVALATSRSLLSVLRNSLRLVLFQFASLYLVGAGAAFAAVGLPWLLVFSLVGAFLVYRSQVHRIELKHESVRAMERMADEVDRRERLKGFQAALDQGQPAGIRLLGIASSGLREHLRREIDAPDPRGREFCEQPFEPDARAASELDGALDAVGHLRCDLTNKPSVEAAVASRHAATDESTYDPAWPAELACEN